MRNVLAVFVGGALGTLARFGLDASFSRSTLITPWLINIVGAFVLGLLVSALWSRPTTPAWVKAGIGTGVLGGFTTFSAITLLLTEAVNVSSFNGGLATTGFYLLVFVLDLALGILAAWAGLVLGRRVGGSASVAPAGSTFSDDDAIRDEGVDL